jgi:ATP-binding cassette, subfamily F, member 3
VIKINQLSKSYSTHALFTDVNLQMNAGDRLGLVGRNGHGKTTLFRLILKQEEPDDGQIVIPRNYRIGHLEQHLHFTQPTILDEAALGLPEEESHSIYKAEAILFGLGFTHADLAKPPQEFSGGFQIRINLAKLLLSEPNLLLLDEPTNYLDLPSVRWITRFLCNFKGEVIVISHDRDFMDGVTTHTAVIHRQKVRKFAGGTAKAYSQIALEEEIHEKTRVNEELQGAGFQGKNGPVAN